MGWDEIRNGWDGSHLNEWGGGETNSRMFVKPNIFHSILIFVQKIWVEIYFWDAYKTQHFQFYSDICVKGRIDGNQSTNSF